MKRSILKPTKISTRTLCPSVFFLFIVGLISSCESPEELGLDLGLNEFPSDTLILKDVRVQSNREDSLRTDNVNFQLLGSINDETFGESKSSIFTQLGLDGSIEIPSDAEGDSVILKLTYINYYGNADAEQSFSVYTLKQPIDNSRSYYNTSSVKLGEKIGEKKDFKFSGSDGSLKIDVSDLWGKSAFRAGRSYTVDTNFQNDFYGIAIVPESDFGPKDGSIVYFNLVSLSSSLVAYYHYTSDDNRQTGEMSLQFQTRVKSFSEFTHNYEGLPINDYFQSDKTDADRGFIQALGGSYVSVDLPEIKSLLDSPIIVFHKVQLVLPCDCDLHDENFTPISFLDIKAQNENGDLSDIPDKSKVYWVRSYDTGKRAYVINITNHAQNLLNNYRKSPDFTDYGLVLKAIKNEPVPFSAGRFVVKGSSLNREDGAYLEVFYSKIDRP